ncbi:MAG: hypothetical protein JJT75_14895 [Opitutales bacterium]|nr:hypothetical protein [Opitutales bacterium]
MPQLPFHLLIVVLFLPAIPILTNAEVIESSEKADRSFTFHPKGRLAYNSELGAEIDIGAIIIQQEAIQRGGAYNSFGPSFGIGLSQATFKADAGINYAWSTPGGGIGHWGIDLFYLYAHSDFKNFENRTSTYGIEAELGFGVAGMFPLAGAIGYIDDLDRFYFSIGLGF